MCAEWGQAKYMHLPKGAVMITARNKRKIATRKMEYRPAGDEVASLKIKHSTDPTVLRTIQMPLARQCDSESHVILLCCQ